MFEICRDMYVRDLPECCGSAGHYYGMMPALSPPPSLLLRFPKYHVLPSAILQCARQDAHGTALSSLVRNPDPQLCEPPWHHDEEGGART